MYTAPITRHAPTQKFGRFKLGLVQLVTRPEEKKHHETQMCWAGSRKTRTIVNKDNNKTSKLMESVRNIVVKILDSLRACWGGAGALAGTGAVQGGIFGDGGLHSVHQQPVG